MNKKVNGKQKGNTFERKVANLLSDRFKNYLGIEKSFRRSSDSGSFFGGSNMKRITEYDSDTSFFGDIICPKKFKYSIECKNYKTAPNFKSIVGGKIAQWDAWLEQAEQDSINSNKLLFLVIKYNNTPEIVFLKHQIEKQEILKYKNYYCYTLEDFLSMDDTIFFD